MAHGLSGYKIVVWTDRPASALKRCADFSRNLGVLFLKGKDIKPR